MSHSLLSPSRFFRAASCLASTYHESRYPATTNVYAEAGTLRHQIAEEILTGKPISSDDIDAVNDAQEYVNYVKEKTQGATTIHVEKKVYFDAYTAHHRTQSYGTSDLIAWHEKAKLLQVMDAKFGHHKVPVEKNEQEMLYALGALELYPDAEQIELHIAQPPINYFASWTIPREQLEEFGEHVKDVSTAIKKIGNKPQWTDYYPTPKNCQYCRHSANCEALRSIDIEEEVDLHKRYADIHLLEAYIAGVKERVFQKLSNGEEVKGFKLVQGRMGNRSWIDAAQALTVLKPQGLVDIKPVSPTQLEKKNKEVYEQLEHLIHRPPGGLVVVPDSDPRITPGKGDEFNE